MTQDNLNPDATGDANENNKGEQPMMRRRRLASPGTPASQDDAATPSHEGDAAPLSPPQTPSILPESSAPHTAPIIPKAVEEPKTFSAGSGRKPMPAPVTTKDATTESPEEEEVTGARRAVRIILILLVFGALWGVLIMYLQQASHEQDDSVGVDIPDGPALQPPVNTSAGDKLTTKLMASISAGDITDITTKATEYRTQFPNHPDVLRAVYLAETMTAVLALEKQLSEMPLPDILDEKMPMSEGIQQLSARMSLLATLDAYRQDWGRMLTGVKCITAVYDKYGREIRNAPALLTSWRQAATLLTRAEEALQETPLPTEKIEEFLRVAHSLVPQKGLIQCADIMQRLDTVEALLNHDEVDDAVTILAEVSVTTTTPATTMLQKINNTLPPRHATLQARVGHWAEFKKALRQAETLHEKGKTSDALEVIAKVTPLFDPNHHLTAGLVQELKLLETRYQGIQTAWTDAQKTENSNDLEAQLKAWARLWSILDSKDVYYVAAARTALKGIKTTIQNRIATEGTLLTTISDAYKGITAQMRRPESPRKPLAAQADILCKEVVLAQDIITLRNLVPNWDLGDQCSQIVQNANDVLGEHSEQGHKLWTLASFYYKQGELAAAHECAQRVLLLGNYPSNPNYSDAKKMLESKKP